MPNLTTTIRYSARASAGAKLNPKTPVIMLHARLLVLHNLVVHSPDLVIAQPLALVFRIRATIRLSWSAYGTSEFEPQDMVVYTKQSCYRVPPSPTAGVGGLLTRRAPALQRK